MSEDKLSLPVETVMRAPPLTAQFSDTISTIVDRMVTYDVGCCLIMSGGGPIGIITEKDIMEKIVRAGKDASKTFAKDIMSSPIVTIECNKPISQALRTMRDKHIRRLGVIKAGKLVGILTERRLLDSLVT